MGLKGCGGVRRVSRSGLGFRGAVRGRPRGLDLRRTGASGQSGIREATRRPSMPPKSPDGRAGRAQALELGTHVGQPHRRWRYTAGGSLTDVPDSNGCTQLQPLWTRTTASLPSRNWAFEASQPRASVGVRYARWTTAPALEIHGPRISHRCTGLQRLYTTPTSVDQNAARLLHSRNCAFEATRPRASVGVRHTRWTTAPALEIHGRRISHRCTGLQRLYTTPTSVHQNAARLRPAPLPVARKRFLAYAWPSYTDGESFATQSRFRYFSA